MEFLDIILTKDFGPLLHAVHSRSSGGLVRERILGHQFDRKLVSVAPCYSQSLLGGFYRTPKTTLFKKSMQKKKPALVAQCVKGLLPR
jgi:hypothetical protein